ncbi:TIGR03032 family protein [Bernardetia sp.]|uniref:TIGR03032 family protein n=1 Tax=Bernardetia sp. TaxID=1937974 RepID=UPI0025BA71F0|nr:TIGR03032 family protein [Bernardetia sp.]
MPTSTTKSTDNILSHKTESETTLHYNSDFLEWLHQEEISLAISTYQTNKLFLVGRDTTKHLFVSEKSFDRAMGLHVESENSFYLSTRFLLWRFENALAEGQIHKEADKVYIPRQAFTTGDLDAHDISKDENGNIVFVNTRYNCIAQISEKYNFKPIWTPPFITKMVSEDRCHLNGMAMRDGKPRYVTMVGQTDRLDEWREHRKDGGVVMDIQNNEVLAEGLSMPHSPRYYQDKLWVLNAGKGQFGYVEDKKFVPITWLDGFLRGLAFYKNYAIIGLSKPRHERTFAGLPLEEILENRKAEPKCGVFIVDINTGNVLHSLEYEGNIVELYDVEVLQNTKRPSTIDIRNRDICSFIAIEKENDNVEFKALSSLEDNNPSAYSSQALSSFPTNKPLPKRPTQHKKPNMAATSKEAIKYQASANISLQQVIQHFGKLTFPKLEQLAKTRKVNEPLMAIIAHNGQHQVGCLILEALPNGVGKVLSWYIIPPYRSLGIGKELLIKAQNIAKKVKLQGLAMDYVSDWTQKDVIEAIIDKQKWEKPIVKLSLCKASNDSINTAPWLKKLPPLPLNMEIGMWKDVTEVEKKVILEKKKKQDWYPEIVSPFQSPHLISLDTSVVLRREGKIVGWIITHKIKEDTIEFTGSFVDFKSLGLQKKSLLIHLISKAVNCFLDAGYKYGIWQIPQDHNTMFRFTDKFLKPYLISFTEQKVAYKPL